MTPPVEPDETGATDFDKAVDWMVNKMDAVDHKLVALFWRISEGEITADEAEALS